MIVVLADDFSGAAELAEIAVRAGLSAELQMQFTPEAEADVLCVDADTRPLSAEAAAARFAEIGRAVAAVRPAMVFKKCDSVLRGHVAAESRPLAAALGKARVLLVPANPSRGRIIRGGEYLVHGVPLAETAFARDPEHPRRTSRVAELLGDTAGICFPDVPDAAAVAALAQTVGASTLPVGAADFFEALLPRSRGVPAPWQSLCARAPRLFVCGSAAAWLTGRKEQCAQHRVPICAMPQALFARQAPDDIAMRWAEFAANALREHGAAMLAIGSAEPATGVTPAVLASRLAQAVDAILDRVECARICLEGGATAAAVLRELGHRRFSARPSPGAGVGAFVARGKDGPLFLTKPGSYDWPETVWSD
jgi:uncharacterized protein YgbK (DUF1537 family)